jgi:hypothetical protein
VNYLLNTLTSSGPNYGALDLGGASTQITFRPAGDLLAGFFDLRLGGNDSAIYTHSWCAAFLGHCPHRELA